MHVCLIQIHFFILYFIRLFNRYYQNSLQNERCRLHSTMKDLRSFYVVIAPELVKEERAKANILIIITIIFIPNVIFSCDLLLSHITFLSLLLMMWSRLPNIFTFPYASFNFRSKCDAWNHKTNEVFCRNMSKRCIAVLDPVSDTLVHNI